MTPEYFCTSDVKILVGWTVTTEDILKEIFKTHTFDPEFRAKFDNKDFIRFWLGAVECEIQDYIEEKYRSLAYLLKYELKQDEDTITYRFYFSTSEINPEAEKYAQEKARAFYRKSFSNVMGGFIESLWSCNTGFTSNEVR